MALPFCVDAVDADGHKVMERRRHQNIYVLLPFVPPLYHRETRIETHSNTYTMRGSGLRINVNVILILCWQITALCFFNNNVYELSCVPGRDKQHPRPLSLQQSVVYQFFLFYMGKL